jgi:hypothetical protein
MFKNRLLFSYCEGVGGASDAELVFGASTVSCGALFGKSHIEISDLKSSKKGVDSKHVYQTLISTDYEQTFSVVCRS